MNFEDERVDNDGGSTGVAQWLQIGDARGAQCTERLLGDATGKGGDCQSTQDMGRS